MEIGEIDNARDVFSIVISIIESMIEDKGCANVTTVLQGSTRIQETGIDSISVFDLACRIEETFGVAIPDCEFDIENFRTIDTVVSLVSRLMEK